MKRTKILLGTAALACTVVACDGLKEAFTAHVDTVAKAQGQELTTERLATLLGNSQIPVRKDIASTIADFWVSYQLLGYAGAHADTLPDSTSKNWWVSDTKAIDDAMWSAIMGSRTRAFFEKVSQTFAMPDTTNLEQKYNQSTSLAAQHILLPFPEGPEGQLPAKQEAVRRKAEDIRKRVTSENFGAMAKQYSEDPGSKDNNGTYAMFPQGQMVPEFENAVRSVKPGEIAPGLIKTSYGFHIIRRHTLAEVRQQFIDDLIRQNAGTAQTGYIEKLRADWKVTIKPDAPAKAKAIAENPGAARDDKTALATSRLGNFTAARLVEWIDVIPASFQIRERLTQSPDSLVVNLLQSIIDQEILNAQAEKEDIEPDSGEVKEIRRSFTQMVQFTLSGLRVDPKSLSDSAKTTGEKERLAASRIEYALDQVFKAPQNMVEVPPQLASLLRKKYSSRVNQTGVDRSVEQATAIRAGLDTARANSAPSLVPPPQPPTGGTGSGSGDTTGTSKQ
jgi:hypothetical protein